MNSKPTKPILPLQYLGRDPPSSSVSERLWRRSLGVTFNQPLDRVAVLGDDNYGHESCVNALSWTPDGRTLLSGGDDRTIRIWNIDPSQTEGPYPFACTSVIRTGHRANIFNAHLLPYSHRIATVAGDKQIRIFEAGMALSSPQTDREVDYQVSPRILRCHTDRVKRIVTEDSPDLFLTVSEDGCVRQHDLRVPHTCSPRGSCPAPLVHCQFDLSALALSPLTPYQFVVAGESPYGYLFDRRFVGRFLQEEWGFVPTPSTNNLALCVRRFGREKNPDSSSYHRTHITGARVSSTNGHEVLLSYSGDAVYLFSTHDDPRSSDSHSHRISLPPNDASHPIPISSTDPLPSEGPVNVQDFEDASLTALESTFDTHDGEGDYMDQLSDDENHPEYYPDAPIVFPRRRYAGAANVETVKDVNFLGPGDEFVTSGSDDGNFFVWHKDTGVLHGIYEGDGSVVNVIEQHPYWPLVAVSGIDASVKLFSPVHRSSTFSRMNKADEIIAQNSRYSAHQLTRSQFALIRAALGADVSDGEGPCNVQ